MSRLNKLALATVLALALAGAAAAHPPTEPDHGLNESEFVRLWSEDTGSTVSPNDSVSKFVSGASDYTYTDPPAEVEDWNRGEFGELGTLDFDDRNTSIHPRGVELGSSQNGTIKDAFVEVFAVEPGTRAHRSRGEQAIFIGDEGILMAVVDYRVEVPSGAELVSDGVVETRLVSLGRTLGNDSSGEHTPEIDYEIEGFGVRASGLSLESRIEATFRRGSGRSAVYWTENVTVRKPLRVATNRLIEPTAYKVNYPDGDRGIVVVHTGAWRGVQLPDGSVRTQWRYFTKRTEPWDELVVSSGGSPRTVHSPGHPVVIHAYPSKNGVRALSDVGTGKPKVVRTAGVNYRPPELPESVSVNVVDDEYKSVYAIEAEYDPSSGQEPVRYMGIVRGVENEVQVAGTRNMTETELGLEVIDETSTHVTLRITLKEKESGRPIRLEGRAGYVELMGSERVNTSSDGTARTIIRKPNDYVRAEYVPGAWWRHRGAFMPSTATLAVGNEFVGPLGVATGAFRIFGFLLPFLLVVFMLDRMLGLDLWPPWKKI